MSKKPKTHVVIILDKSGSMSNKIESTVSNYNEQIDEIKNNAKEQDIDVSLLTFGSNVFEHFWRKNPETLELSNTESYRSIISGCTALNDAWGYAIDKLLDETESEVDSTYLLILLTDGEENSSKNYDINEINSRVTELEASGRWTFTLMGCSKNLLEELCNKTNMKRANVTACNLDDPNMAIAGGKFARSATKGYFETRKQNLNCTDYYKGASEALGFAVTNNSAVSLNDTMAAAINDTSVLAGNANVFSDAVAADFGKVKREKK